MQNYVVTGFNDLYWSKWGISWLVSLKELAKYNIDNIIIIGFDLSQDTNDRIKESGVNLISRDLSLDIRQDTLRLISDISVQTPGNFVYWDADVFFQESIDQIFDLIDDEFLLTSNPGFLAGSNQSWIYLKDIFNTISFFGEKMNIHDFILNHFNKFVTKVEDIWNFTDIPNLKEKDRFLVHNEVVQKVIHLSGPIKFLLGNKNILFCERYKDLYQNFISHNKTSRKLITSH